MSTVRVSSLDLGVPEDRVQTDAEVCRAASADLYSAGTPCVALVCPESVDEVQSVVRAAARAGLGVVPRGAGLTYSGGCVANSNSCIVLDVHRLNRIVDLNVEDMYVTAEAGCTWRQLHSALAAHGRRLPCFGTHSGARATVGGGLSGGAVFFGTARFGTVADALLGLDVVLADGQRVRTGQGAFRHVRHPAYRGYGPDITGLFVHDAGALGVKVQATLRTIVAPAFTAFASMAFDSIQSAARALADVARHELAEEAFVLDPASTARALGGATLAQGVRTIGATLRGPGALHSRAAAAARLVVEHRRIANAGNYTLHVVCAGRCEQAVAADVAAVQRIARGHRGTAISDAIPRGMRANLFPPLNGVLGADGSRWIALNAKVAHSDALALIDAAEAELAAREATFERTGVRVSRMMMAVSNHAFSYEPVFHWRDTWLPLHRSTPEPGYLAAASEPPPNAAAREQVHEARHALLALFAARGAASNQIGRIYPYLDSMDPAARSIVERVKHVLDPEGRMNPGALGLELASHDDC